MLPLAPLPSRNVAPVSITALPFNCPDTDSVPPEARVAPVYEVLPDKVSVPEPCLTRPPVPAMSLDQVDVPPGRLTLTSPQSKRAGPKTALPTFKPP